MARKRLPHAPRVTVEVDTSAIDDSVPRDSSHCMIAEAVRRSIPGAIRISVDLQTIRFSDPGKRLRYTYLTPRAAQVALVQFDSGIRPDPFAVRLVNGQVTAMGRPQTRTPQQEQERKEHSRETRAAEARARAREAGQQELADDLSRTTLRQAAGVGGGDNGAVPVRTGGRTPPRMAFAARRTFGIRALERLDPSGVATMTH